MPIKVKKEKKKQKQKQKQVVSQRVVVNLADTKPRRKVARRRTSVKPSVNVPQIVTQYIPIQSGASVPSIVKYYNNIMTPKAEPSDALQAVRQQQQEDYTNAIKQSAKEEDNIEMKQAEAGIINSLVAERDDMDVMNRAIIQQAEEFNKPKKKKKKKEKLILKDELSAISVDELVVARRGRPVGSKNKPKEVLEQERLKKQAKRDARERRREERFRRAGYFTENPQTE